MNAAIEDIYPLSPLQQGLLFHTLSEPDAGLYIEQMSWSFRGALNVRAFERAWDAVVARHPIFRTAFAWEEGDQPLQIVFSHVAFPIARHDWRGLPQHEQQQRLDALLADEGRRPFDLMAPPLMRVAVVHLADELHHVVWTTHHLLLDGWSVPLTLNEVFDFYEGRGALLPPARPYRDYIAWLAEQDRDAARRYWRELLDGADVPTPLPAAARPAPRRDRSLDAQLSSSASEALSALSRHQRVTVNTIFQSVWALLLARYSGRDDVVFGSVVSGRPPALPGVESMIGLFINALPLRVRIPDGDATLASWWQELQAQQAEQRQYEFCSLVDIRAWAGLPANRPLFETLVGFENYPVRADKTGGHGSDAPGLAIGDVRSSSRTNYPLTALVVPGPALKLRFLYDASRIDDATAARMLEQVRMMLELCAEQPGRSPRSLMAALPAAELRAIEAWRAATADYPRDAAVHELFAAQAARTPDAIAVEFDAERLMYAELESRANRLARHLMMRGVKDGAPVAVSLPRSAELIVALLAVLKAGGAYVPVDPDYPEARRRWMLGDSGAVFVIDSNLDRDAVAAEDDAPLPCVTRGGDRAYLMYTSGSTGRPKGTIIPHRAIARLVLSTNYLQLTPADRVAQASTASFDAATFEIWGPLLNGGTVVGVGRDELLDPDRLARVLRERRITAMFVTTGLFHQIARARPDAFATLDTLLFGGERADPRAVNAVFASGPRRLVHVYGPTECTTFATWHEVTEAAEGNVPIGGPIANTEVHLLDRDLHPVPIGAPGEIFLGGDGLADGYLNDPQLTASRFVAHPFIAGARLYRTGDLCRHRPSGTIDFLGRADDQVKIRGFRVEPGEVRAALLEHALVRDAVVVAADDGAGGRRLIAYIVSEEGEEELRRHLAGSLPAFMIPAAFVKLDALPLNANGKVDRNALPAPFDAAGPAFVPRTAVEERMLAIWRDVLGPVAIGPEQSFFDLGGHSLTAIQLVSRIRDEFQVDLPLRHVFEAPLAVQLAARVEELLIARLESLSEEDARRMLEGSA